MPLSGPTYEATASTAPEPTGAGFGGRKFVGPKSQERPSADYCEGWSKETKSEMHYIALVRLKTGALLNIIGSAPSASFAESLPAFRDAVSELNLVQGRSPKARP